MSLSNKPKTVPQELGFDCAEPMTRQLAATELRNWRKMCRTSRGRCHIHCHREASANYYEFMDVQHIFAFQPNPISIPRMPKPERDARITKAFEAGYGGGMAVSNVQELAVGQRRRMAEGISYGYRLEPGITDAQVLALLQIKDMLRRVGMAIMDDGMGRVAFVKRAVGDQSPVAYSMFV